jgi:ATP-dependent Zn protease
MDEKTGPRRPGQGPGENPQNPVSHWTIILWLLLGFLLLGPWVSSLLNSKTTQISYTDFRSQLESGNVQQVMVRGEKITGQLKKPAPVPTATGPAATYTDFFTYVPSFGDPQLLGLLETQKVKITAQPQKNVSWWGEVLSGLLPFLILIGFAAFLLRKRGLGGTQGIFSFAGSRAHLYDQGKERTTLRDVAGAHGAKIELQEIIVFIDELDSVGQRRGISIGGGQDEREHTLNQLLSEMDGFEPNEHVVVMAATNRPDVLDAALLRPGRFDRHITVDLPSLKDRVEILKIHARDKPLSTDVNLEEVARGTPGFSGADLENLLNEAALLAARRHKDRIDSKDIDNAIDKLLMGLERENIAVTSQERRLVAYHEGGHAVVAAVLPNTDPIHKVTIVPRGQAMGVTQRVPGRETYIYPKEYLLNRLAVMMGGRAAEQVVAGLVTSSAANDLRQATALARRMVLKQSYNRAVEVLREHRDGLDRVAQDLLDKEEVTGKEVMELVGVSRVPLPLEEAVPQGAS